MQLQPGLCRIDSPVLWDNIVPSIILPYCEIVAQHQQIFPPRHCLYKQSNRFEIICFLTCPTRNSGVETQTEPVTSKWTRKVQWRISSKYCMWKYLKRPRCGCSCLYQLTWLASEMFKIHIKYYFLKLQQWDGEYRPDINIYGSGRETIKHFIDSFIQDAFAIFYYSGSNNPIVWNFSFPFPAYSFLFTIHPISPVDVHWSLQWQCWCQMWGTPACAVPPARGNWPRMLGPLAVAVVCGSLMCGGVLWCWWWSGVTDEYSAGGFIGRERQMFGWTAAVSGPPNKTVIRIQTLTKACRTGLENDNVSVISSLRDGCSSFFTLKEMIDSSEQIFKVRKRLWLKDFVMSICEVVVEYISNEIVII